MKQMYIWPDCRWGNWGSEAVQPSGGDRAKSSEVRVQVASPMQALCLQHHTPCPRGLVLLVTTPRRFRLHAHITNKGNVPQRTVKWLAPNPTAELSSKEKVGGALRDRRWWLQRPVLPSVPWGGLSAAAGEVYLLLCGREGVLKPWSKLWNKVGSCLTAACRCQTGSDHLYTPQHGSSAWLESDNSAEYSWVIWLKNILPQGKGQNR